jgi:hypothetical protein
MTADNLPANYVASGYTTLFGYSAYLAFNRNLGDDWIGILSDRYLKIDLGAANNKTINHYAITASAGFPWGAPLSWDLQGSNDDSAWNTLHIVTNCLNWSSNETRCFINIGNVISYRYYRLNNIISDGSNVSVRIAEWQLAETI